MTNHEAIHGHLFSLHWAVYRDAIGHLNAALTELYAAERSPEDRRKIHTQVEELEGVRMMLEAALERAGRARSEIIRQTGCDGSCKSSGA